MDELGNLHINFHYFHLFLHIVIFIPASLSISICGFAGVDNNAAGVKFKKKMKKFKHFKINLNFLF
jgi:hypothetical protein